MVDHESLIELNDDLRNHLSDILQTHESYQIQWESRLNNAIAECAKEFQIFDRLCRFRDDAAFNYFPGGARLEEQMGQ